MIDFNQAISIIRRNGGFKPNRKDTSYYRTYTVEGNRPLQARISNHGTWLWTWYDKDFDPSYAINFCIVFSEDGEYDSDVTVDMNIKDEEGNVIGQRKMFEVIQYVYNCQLLDINDATLINQQIQSIWQNKGFNDPFANTEKHAKVMRLKPNEPIEQIVENKQYKRNTNMNKKQIRLTESDLKQIVKESVNKILNEAYGTSPQKDINIANRYANAPNPEFDANTNLSWTTEDEYNDTAPEIREMAICFSKIHDIIRSLKIGLNKDKNGSSDIRNMRRGIRPIKPKNSNALVGMDNYLYTLDKIVDKGKLVLHKMTDRIIQNMGLNPKDEPSSY